MKKLFFFFLLLPVFSFAQNWSPVNQTEAFNYKFGNDAVITVSIHIDSILVSGADSIFYTHPQICDSCKTIVGGPAPCDSCYGIMNLAVFLKKEITKDSSGNYWFSNPGLCLLKRNSNLNDSWLFDSVSGTTATVISVSQQTVFSTSDSVKTILLSNGDTISWSQSFGILQWPDSSGRDFHLVGINGRNLGTYVPRMKDYYNLNQGDIFCYMGSEWNGMSMTGHGWETKYVISTKSQSGDTLRYHINGLSKLYYPPNWFYTDSIDDDIVYIDSVRHFGNLFNQELMITTEGLWRQIYSPGSSLPAILPTELFVDTNGRNGIRYGAYQQFMGSEGMIQYPGFGDTIPEINTMLGQYVHFSGALAEGMGEIYFEASDEFENGNYYILTGAVIGGDTIGVVRKNVYYYVGVENLNESLQIKIFPNPASDQFTVSLPENANATIEILDVQGRSINSYSGMNGVNTIRTEQMNDGLYFLKIQTADYSLTRKIIVTH